MALARTTGRLIRIGWAIMKPMQEPLPTRAEGEWWANLEEVFHTD